ncbi:MAG: hypothetical protein J6Q89_06970 [Clostridia bacterium]|nr:hypothetical protein [Clostridia bacterium]
MFKNKRTEILVIALILIIQSVYFVYIGNQKAYLHMDEAYSFGLSSYDKVEIQDSEDFYNTWHSAEYYRDYLIVDSDEQDEYSQVYENQKNDVHPPFYYLLLRVFMGFSVDNFTMWGGLALNIVIHLFITVFTYLIIKKMLCGCKYEKEKAALLSLLSVFMLSTLTSMLYIRMYALATLNILITVYLHILLYENSEKPYKYIVAIGISALVGSLTHYFYLYFIFALFLLFMVSYLEKSQYKILWKYALSLVVAAGISLLIFPHSLNHMFFGYRGQGVIENLVDPSKYVNVFPFLGEVAISVFNYMLFAIVALIALVHFYKRMREKYGHVCDDSRYAFIIVGFPTLFYYVIVSISSPWIELRYMLPICILIFIIIMCYLHRLLGTMTRESVKNGLMIMLACVMLVTPRVTKIKPDPMFDERREVVQYIEENAEKPAFYFFDSNNDRFLDDIMLFSMIDDSYIAYDIGANAEKIAKVFEGVDVSNGVVVFVSENYDGWEMIHTVRAALNLEHADYMYRLNACDVFFVYDPR